MVQSVKSLFFAVLVAAGSVVSAHAGDANTTRIIHGEPYGAVVTDENGVLVFRALPSVKHVVINPGGKTPLTINMNEITQINRYEGPKVIVVGAEKRRRPGIGSFYTGRKFKRQR